MNRAVAGLCGLGVIAGAIALWKITTTAPSPTTPPEPTMATHDAAVDGSEALTTSTTKRDGDSGASDEGARPIHHVLSTGQSLSIGTAGGPPLSVKQPFGNLMFAKGVQPGGRELTAFAPLVEGPMVETMSSGLANLVSQLASGHDLLISAHGIDGTPYAGLKKGTAAYAEGLAQARAARAVAKKMERPYRVIAITNVHGESDHTARNSNYERDLLEWQSDYERDVRSTGDQAEPIPMLQSQMSSWSAYGDTTSEIPAAQLAAHVHGGGKVVLVGPKYHLEYGGDGVHLSNIGYRHMGEDYAKVYRRLFIERATWEPVRPKSIVRQGKVVIVKFFVPSPPLVLDETIVTNPGNYGFEWFEEAADGTVASGATITDVRLTGPDSVAVTLSAEPTGGSKRLRYAFTSRPSVGAGPKSGPRGNLRDSDATPSRHDTPLYNWCVHFDEPVP